MTSPAPDLRDLPLPRPESFRYEERELVPVLDALSGAGPGPALGRGFWEP